MPGENISSTPPTGTSPSNQSKICSKCGMEKSLDLFQRAPGTLDGRKASCASCCSAAARAFRRNPKNQAKLQAWREVSRLLHDPDRDRERKWLKRYGISREDYELFLQKQGGGCAICSRKPPEGRHLHVDHNHKTGKVRGLLCFSCNSALGKFGDEAEGFKKVVAYLESK